MDRPPLKSGQAIVAQSAPVTRERPSRIDTDTTIERPYLPRASVAPSVEKPDGSARYSEVYSNYSVLQQHCLFWDTDRDGIIWPLDTFRGFRDLGFNLLFSISASIVIHAALSLPTRLALTSYVPDPFFRIFLETIHSSKHGSDSGVFDTEGRFVPCKFEDMWCKYVLMTPKTPVTSMSFFEFWVFLHGSRVAMDPFGWVATFLEWLTAFLLVQQNGMVEKEDVRRILDGSLFFEIRDARRSGRGWNKGWGLGGDGFIGGEQLLPFGL